MTPAVLAADVHLFDIEPETQRVTSALGNYQLLGDSHLFTPNEPNAVVINYYLKAKAASPVKATVADASGEVLAEIAGKGEAGLNTVFWDMRPRRPGQKPAPFPGFGGRRLAEPGEYVITLEAAGKKLTKRAVIRCRQGWTVGPTPAIIR
jgi:hypothetical protein